MKRLIGRLVPLAYFAVFSRAKSRLASAELRRPATPKNPCKFFFADLSRRPFAETLQLRVLAKHVRCARHALRIMEVCE